MAIVERWQLVEEFQDTLKFCEEEPILREAVSSTNKRTRVYAVDFAEEVSVKKDGNVRVESGRTLQAALRLHAEFPEKRIAVLNFAASGTPGGGVRGGSYAQEESICRCSTLYPSLLTKAALDGFYRYPHDWRASDTCVYSPDVVIVRDDSDLLCDRLRPEEFVKVDVITCAAPHVFRNVAVSYNDLLAIHVMRAKNIMRVCAYNGADILVTGAFGCGAFNNPPETVSKAWHEAMRSYGEKFDLVDFVVYVSDYPAKQESGRHNLQVFTNEFCGEDN